MRGREGADIFGPSEMEFLQECFDTILERRKIVRSSELAEVVAGALMEAYSRGVTEKEELIRLADFRDIDD